MAGSIYEAVRYQFDQALSAKQDQYISRSAERHQQMRQEVNAIDEQQLVDKKKLRQALLTDIRQKNSNISVISKNIQVQRKTIESWIRSPEPAFYIKAETAKKLKDYFGEDFIESIRFRSLSHKYL